MNPGVGIQKSEYNTGVGRRIHAYEGLILGYFAALSVLLMAVGARGVWKIHLVDGLMIALTLSLAAADARLGGRFWRFVRCWMVVVVILVSYRVLFFVVPLVTPFSDVRFDRALAALDRRWFGDVYGFVSRLWWRPFVDFLHVCYWFYFPMPAILMVALWRRGEFDRWRETVTSLFAGFYAGYFGYMVVPALGPHRFEPRAAALDGAVLGGSLHRLLVAVEWVTPDAFPSLHAMAGALTLAQAWRFHRPTFWALLVPGAGLVAATVILRYHYVVDVAAGLALTPVALVVGRALAGGSDGPEDEVSWNTPSSR